MLPGVCVMPDDDRVDGRLSVGPRGTTGDRAL